MGEQSEANVSNTFYIALVAMLVIWTVAIFYTTRLTLILSAIAFLAVGALALREFIRLGLTVRRGPKR